MASILSQGTQAVGPGRVLQGELLVGWVVFKVCHEVPDFRGQMQLFRQVDRWRGCRVLERLEVGDQDQTWQGGIGWFGQIGEKVIRWVRDAQSFWGRWGRHCCLSWQ